MGSTGLLRALTAHPANPPAKPLLIAYSKLCFSIFLGLSVVLETSGMVPTEPERPGAVSLIGVDWGRLFVLVES